MAYIYKIINDINEKIYVGKTNLSIEERWRQHKKDRSKIEAQKRPLYRAIKKYGIEYFHIELIEECTNDIVNEREKYWIEQYGSFKHGYNATIGGDGKPYLDYELIYLTYKQTKNIAETSRLCQADAKHIGKILESYGITHEEIKRNKELNSQKPVARLDKKTGKILEVFPSIKKAEEKYPQTNKHIAAVCKGKRKSCGGYGWKYLED